MIVIDTDQRSEDWYKHRLGLPTASNFKNILTGTGKVPTANRTDNYCNLLLAEWLSGGPVETYQSSWMQRGIETEQEAVDAYEFITGNDTETVGFVLHDSRMFGCSPDRFLGEDGLVEIKCPAPHTHVSYLLSGKLPTDYIPQVQGQMLVTGREYVDFASYCPGLDLFVIRVERDEKYIDLLTKQLHTFNGVLITRKDCLIERGYKPMERA